MSDKFRLMITCTKLYENYEYSTRFEVFTAVKIQVDDIRIVKPYSIVTSP
jgi:hypothetical protein